MAVRSFPANVSDKNLFFHVNRGARINPQEKSYGVPKRFSEPSPYHSHVVPAHPLARPPKRGGDASAHYRLLRRGLLPKVPTFKRRVFTDFDPETRIEESIPRTREERQQDKLVKGVSDISSAFSEFVSRPDVPYRQKVQASHKAMTTLFEKYNVPFAGRVKDLTDALKPEEVTHIFERLVAKFSGMPDVDAVDAGVAERLIIETLEGERGHEHKHELRGEEDLADLSIPLPGEPEYKHEREEKKEKSFEVPVYIPRSPSRGRRSRSRTEGRPRGRRGRSESVPLRSSRRQTQRSR